MLCAGALAVACSPSDSTPATVEDTTAPTDPVAEPDDRELRLGVLLPLSGAGAELGTSMRDAIDLAVVEINEAGGVNGRPVRLFVEDEGDAADTAVRAVESLVDRDVDAIVGPASSLLAPVVLPITTRTGTLTCSPGASAESLDAYPDEGLFLRTIPSDSLQAVAMARVVEQTGRTAAGILYVDDAYGRPFAELVESELVRRSVQVVAVEGFDPADVDYTDEVRSQIAGGAGVVAIIGDTAAGPRVVATVFDESDELDVVINDPMRVPAIASSYERLSPAQLERITGVSPQARIVSADFEDRFLLAHPDSRGLFAMNAYDCVTVIALAANAGPTTQAAGIADQVVAVTAVGEMCTTFTSCDSGLRAGRNIDYDGPSGQLQIGLGGDPVRGTFDVFGFAASGRDVSLRTIVVSA